MMEDSIQAGDGAKNVQVGQLIALLAEEGDDISNLEVPKAKESVAPPPKESSPQQPAASTSSSASSTSSVSNQSHPPVELDHSKPMFPSVLRLLQENGISPDQIKGTGIRGMLTKGDVLTFMGQASNPTGTWKAIKESPIPKSVPKVTKVGVVT